MAKQAVQANGHFVPPANDTHLTTTTTIGGQTVVVGTGIYSPGTAVGKLVLGIGQDGAVAAGTAEGAPSTPPTADADL